MYNIRPRNWEAGNFSSFPRSRYQHCSWNRNLAKPLMALSDVEILISTLTISLPQGFLLGIVLGVSKYTREHSNAVPQIIVLLIELRMKIPLCQPSCVQCLPSRLVPSISLHFVYVLGQYLAWTSLLGEELMLMCSGNQNEWNQMPFCLSLQPYIIISSRLSSTGQQLEPLHRAVQVLFLVLLNFRMIKVWSVFSRGMQ